MSHPLGFKMTKLKRFQSLKTYFKHDGVVECTPHVLLVHLGGVLKSRHLFLIFDSPLCFSLARFRLLCQSIIAHKLFDYVVLAFIFLNCITVALERPKIMQGSLVRTMFLHIPYHSSATEHLQDKLVVVTSYMCWTHSVVWLQFEINKY